MPTFEVVCTKCGQKKWPDLPERPERYVCALCKAITPVQREQRLATGQRLLQTRKTRLRTPQHDQEAKNDPPKA